MYNGLRVVDDRGGTPGHCKNQPSDHGQLAGISKAHLARVFIPSRARGTDTLVRREPRISGEIPSSDVQNWVRTPRADRKRHAMCSKRRGGRFVQTMEHGVGSPGAARGRVLLCKLIVKTSPQITVNWPVSASSPSTTRRLLFLQTVDAARPCQCAARRTQAGAQATDLG